jgi:hypothetical protein
MDLNTIREALHRQPFQPFSLRLADGRSLEVPHPDFMAMTKRIVIVVAEDNSWKAVDPILIVSLGVDPSSPSSNGAGRKRRRPRGE